MRGIGVLAGLALICSMAVPVAAQNQSGSGSASAVPTASSTDSAPPDSNRQIFYKNKLEASFDVSYMPWNVPLLVDPILGYGFHRSYGTVNYTLIPMSLMLRWQLYDVSGRSFWRGNTELSLGGNYTSIPQGPESYYRAMLVGVRYNFVQPEWKFVPYVDLHGGFGWTNAQQPYEKAHHLREVGQGQDFTFTFIFGVGVRYDFNPRYSLSMGLAYMHISNAYLSTPQYYNHAVNVIGPNWGFNVAL
ncbi:MAG: acyloxyacyl hydrolase [Candidatus Binataceae bacterium]|nr:acyloxyacyl hydrolase [Candidatus Binataceae bacterium]